MKGWIALLLITSVATAQKADRILVNGNIYTLASKGERVHAVAIAGGRVLAVGEDVTIRRLAGPSTEVIDLQGQTVVPGFNDVHQHPAPQYAWDKTYAVLKLDTVSSMESLVALLKRKAFSTPKGVLIRGEAYNEMRLGGQPLKTFLDRASTDHPILITHASGHVSAANSLLLELSGIDKTTVDPAGGALERNTAGEPDGIIKESARRLLKIGGAMVPPAPTAEEEIEGYRVYFRQLLAHGVTSIGDCWTTPEKVNIYQQLMTEGFPLRINCYVGVDFLDGVLSGAIPRLSGDYLRIQGIKMFHGNSLSGKTCWLSEPYDTINPATGKKDYYGIPPARSQGALDSLVAKINHAGLQIACHSNGDREIAMVLTAFERAQQAEPHPGIRNRIEHCSIVTHGLLERIRQDSVIPVIHSYANELGDQLLVYGPARLSLIMPTRTLTEMGVVWAMHSDYPVSHYDPMRRLDGAVNRRSRSGKIIGAEQAIDVETAIQAYCIGGAYTTHEEDRKGRLVAGQFADLVVLDRDPASVPSSAIKEIRVTMTFVGGKQVYRRI